MKLSRYAQSLMIALLLSFFAASQGRASPCPAVGADTGCGVVITITNSGASISSTGQGPYDGDDDTLVGVINNSNQSIYALGLSSQSNIFGFDGDGITTYGISGNNNDPSGYGGPFAYFSNINTANTTGVVNFTTPIPANGGQSYFSLENALTTPTAVQDIVNGSIVVSLDGQSKSKQPTEIHATFTPNLGLTIAEAAAETGFKNFDWRQTIVSSPSQAPFKDSFGTPISAPPAFLDPVPGGYDYCRNDVNCQVAYPFYYNDFNLRHQCLAAMSLIGCISYAQTDNVLNFFDLPYNPKLLDGTLTSFTTELFGVLDDFSAGVDCLTLSTPTCVDLGVGFTWTSNYTGSIGGVARTFNDILPDPNIIDGTGGIVLTGINEVSNVQIPNTISVTTINGVSLASTIDMPEPPTILLLAPMFMFVYCIKKYGIRDAA